MPDGSLDLGSAGRANESQVSALLDKDLHWVLSFVGVDGSIFHQQGHGYLVGVHSRPPGYLQAQPLERLGDGVAQICC